MACRGSGVQIPLAPLIFLLTEGRAEEQQLVIVQEKGGFNLCGDYDQVVQEEKIRQVIDDLNDRQIRVGTH